MLKLRALLVLALAGGASYVRLTCSDWHAYGCRMADGTQYTAVADYRSELPKGCALYERYTHVGQR